MCVKAMNDTLEPEGLKPSALVSGVFPSTRVFEDPQDPKPSLQYHARLANFIRAEMEKQLSTLRLNRALIHSNPPLNDRKYEV